MLTEMRGMSFNTTHYEKYPIYFDVYLSSLIKMDDNTLCKQNVGHYTFWTPKAIMALTKLSTFCYLFLC